MLPKRPRARRYPFVASVELTDVQSGIQITGRTSDLSVFGCQVETEKMLAAETKVRARISHGGVNCVALARATNVRPNVGMGIVFISMEPKDQMILDKWLSELRDQTGSNA